MKFNSSKEEFLFYALKAEKMQEVNSKKAFEFYSMKAKQAYEKYKKEKDSK